MDITVHRVTSIELGKVRRSTYGNNQPYCFRDLIIRSSGGDVTITVFPAEDANEEQITPVSLAEVPA